MTENNSSMAHIHPFIRSILTPVGAALLTTVISGSMLATAFAFQYWKGLAPCELCLWQRWPLGIAAVMGLLTPLMIPRWRGLWLSLIGVIIAIGAGIAVYHVGVEAHWWAGTEACGNAIGDAKNVGELITRILETPVVQCDKVQWSFLGISMAGYNAIISTCVALFTLFVATQQRAEKR